jgi:hypothetical protein
MGIYNRYDTVDNPSFLTFWSYIHLVAGIMLFVVVSFLSKKFTSKVVAPWIIIACAFLLHLLYEFKDMYISYIAPSENSTSNSLLNSVGDQLCATTGIFIAYQALDTSSTPKDVLTFGLLYFNLYVLTLTIDYEDH